MTHIHPLRLIALLLLLGAETLAQTPPTAARPDRGLVNGNSYAVSDIEKVNLTNGNMNLSIPLAALPPIAGGKLSWTLAAIYNSKLWDVVRREQVYHTSQWNTLTVDTPQLSDLGGWTIGGRYQIYIRNAHEDYDYEIPPSTSGYSHQEQQLMVNYGWHKVVLRTPDGGEHELRPTDYQPYPGETNFLRGYYNVTPSATNAIKYYSYDGTYLSAVITGVNNWTVFMPDGTQVVQSANGIQRIKDTNGNSVKIYDDVSGTHYQDEQTGREIKITYDPAANGGAGRRQVWYQTVGSAWVSIDINYGWTQVRGKVYPVMDWNSASGEFGTGAVCQRDETLVPTDVEVVREIVLPQTEPGAARRRFTFSYNSDTTENVLISNYRDACMDFQTRAITASIGWGSLSRMVTPEQAVLDYSYSLDSANEQPLTEADLIPAETVTKKQATHDGTTETWTYGIDSNSGSVSNPDGTGASEMSYTHNPNMAAYSYGRAGLVYRSTRSGIITERHWTTIPFSGASVDSPGGTLSFNPVADAEYTTLTDAQGNGLKMSAKTFAYDYNGNVTQVKEYDWVDLSQTQVSRDSQGVPTEVPPGSVLLRTTNTIYHGSPLSASASNVYAKRTLSTGTPSLLNAVREVSAGASRTLIGYDGQANGVAPTAGNVTSTSDFDDRGDTATANDRWVTKVNTYGAYGNLSATTDAKGNVTQFFYDDATHALPTRAVVDPLNGTGTQTTSTAYDYSTGLVTARTDANGQVSNINYTNQLLGTVDPLGRPGMTLNPPVVINGVSQRRKTFNFYEDGARRLRVETDLHSEGDRLLKSRVTRDMMGRVVLTEQSEDGANYAISARNEYLQAGRITMSSNPRRANGVGSPDGWTRVTNDNMGRVVEVANFTGSAQPPATGVSSPSWAGSVTTSYYANETTVIDQQNKTRKSMTDALGRPTRVIENPAGLNYETIYTYDSLSNLRKVDQGGQLRFFMYDSLSRLVRSKNPEQTANANLAVADPVTGNSQWSLSYDYDLNGNVSTRVDARNITSVYVYDGLNRNTSVDYQNTPTNPTNSVNPDITRAYDGATLGKGRFWYDYKGGNFSAGTVVEHRAVDSYDALGRPSAQRQHFKLGNVWSAPYPVRCSYDMSGNIKTQTYPSGHSVNYTRNDAGHLLDFTGNLGDGLSRNYAVGITYDASGRMTREQFGTQTPLYHKQRYNSRGQMWDVRLSTVGDVENWNRGAIQTWYTYQNQTNGGTGTDNNGNVTMARTYIPHNDQISSATFFEQRYQYDQLNQLTSVNEYLNGQGASMAQVYEYDRWGNRQISAPATSNALNEKGYATDTATNRLSVPSGQTGAMTYDAAGNLIHDSYAGMGARTYDEENHMLSAVSNINGSSSVYSYDADGRRVRRTTPAGSVWQVYGMEGELLAEYAAGAAADSPLKEYGYRNGELLVTAQPANTSTPTYLSDINWTYANTQYYPTMKDHAVEGTPLTLNGAVYAKGLGVHATSDVRFKLGGNYQTFVSDVGVDDFTGSQGSVKFEVWADGVQLYDSGVMTGATATKGISVSVAGRQELKLIVTQAGDGPSYDHADWAGARLFAVSPGVNVAAASSGATASASSIYPHGTYTAASIINGDRKGLNWGAGGGWNDGTPDAYPDWVQVDFAGAKTISEIDVFTCQDNYANPSEPTAGMTFSLYGLTGFDVQYWTGSAWVTVPNAAVTGNNRVWRKFTFAALTTTKIRVATSGGLASYSRLTEVEAYQATQTTNDSVQWLVVDHLGTPRIEADLTGNLTGIKRHDYLPFGEELFAGTGGRTTSQGYGGTEKVRQKFVGYERDNETGLDYAKNRYYSSTQGRYTTVDPMPIKKRHLLDPRDLNRYVYVANNPLRYIDPEGLEKIVVIIRTFIPAEKITHPPAVGATFKGDHNAKGERVSYRTEQRVLIETDANKPNSNNILDNNSNVGKTVRVAGGLGSLTGPSEGQADGKSLQASLSRVNGNTVTVNAKGNESDPLVTALSGNPGITYNFNITVQSEGANGRASVTVSGQHDGFPAYEIIVIRPESGVTSTTVYNHNPNVTGDGAQSLYGSGEYNPDNVRTVIDPRRRPQ